MDIFIKNKKYSHKWIEGRLNTRKIVTINSSTFFLLHPHPETPRLTYKRLYFFLVSSMVKHAVLPLVDANRLNITLAL